MIRDDLNKYHNKYPQKQQNKQQINIQEDEVALDQLIRKKQQRINNNYFFNSQCQQKKQYQNQGNNQMKLSKQKNNSSRSRSLSQEKCQKQVDKNWTKNLTYLFQDHLEYREHSENLNLQQKIERLEQLTNDRSILYLDLDDQNKRMPYNPNRGFEDQQQSVHWGQRKLFLQEIYFLSKYSHLSKNIFYAGAAGGNHIPYLSSFFPTHKFYLIDPGQFNIKANDQLAIYNDYCSKEFINKWLKDILNITESKNNNDDDKRDVLFISDIRTGEGNKQTKVEFEQSVASDNELQKQWTLQLKPQKAMLKFRCPFPDLYHDNQIQMISGDILLQAWAPPDSTETRLITDASQPIRIYDNLIYEQALAYQNYVKRVQNNQFKPPVNLSDKHKVGKQGVDIHGKFDEANEILIWTEYLKNQEQSQIRNEQFFEKIESLSFKLTEKLIELGCERRLCRRSFAKTDFQN